MKLVLIQKRDLLGSIQTLEQFQSYPINFKQKQFFSALQCYKNFFYGRYRFYLRKHYNFRRVTCARKRIMRLFMKKLLKEDHKSSCS